MIFSSFFFIASSDAVPICRSTSFPSLKITIVGIDIRTHHRTHLFGTPGVRGSGAHLLNTPDDAYPLPDGRLKLIDGHLRADIDPDRSSTIAALRRLGYSFPGEQIFRIPR